MAKKTNLGLTYDWLLGEKYKDGMDENLRRISALLHGYALSNQLSDPPSGASDGDVYIVATGGTNDWNGYDDYLAVYDGYKSQWDFYAPEFGMTFFCESVGEPVGGVLKYADSSGWELDANYDILFKNSGGLVTPDMASGNYTLTTDDARYKIIAPLNSASGSVLTIPDTTDVVLPNYYVSGLLVGSDIIVQLASGGSTATVTAGTTTNILCLVGLGAVDIASAALAVLLTKHQPVWETTTTTVPYNSNFLNRFAVFNNPTQIQKFTLGQGDGTTNCKFTLFCDGAGLELEAQDTDVEFIGLTRCASGGWLELNKSGDTDTWYVQGNYGMESF